ncbi:unnamed protein product [Phytomonas sp. EM1]|nr:unnamed protein product [Phytomonas sp. EM1]|eukprot:CCW61933.1 unnamed protein product [Phytomonas sp. isolate EM1]
MTFSENVNSKTTEAFERVREQVDTYAQKGKNSFEEVKGKAADLQHNIQEAVERAKNTADPYVKSTRQMAEHIVESGKEGAHVVASTIHRGVNHASQMCISKNRTFRVISELIAMYVFVWWYLLNLFPFTSHLLKQAYTIAESLKIISLMGKLASLFLSAVDRIPIVGPRLYVIITSLSKETYQNINRLIIQSAIRCKHE